MANRITNRQMFFIIFLSLTTYTTIDLPKKMAQTAGRSSWIPMIAASVFFGLTAVIIAKLNNMFPGKAFFEYSQEIAGKFFTCLITVYFILYFLGIGVYLKLKLVGLLKSNFLPKTPVFVTLLFGILLFAYVSYKGITNIARLFEIIGFLFLCTTVGICLLMLFQGESANALPLFNPNEAKQYLGAAKYFVMPFGGIEVLLIIPFTPMNRKAPKVAFFTLLFIGLFYVLNVESTIMTLGLNNTIVLNDAFIEAVKLVEAPVIERLDIFYLTFGLTSLFAGKIIIFTAVAEFSCKIFSKVKRSIIVTVIGFVFLILCFFALKIQNLNDIYDRIAHYFMLTSCGIIPIVFFITAKVKARAVK